MEILCRLITIYLFVVILRIILGMVIEFGQIPWGHPVRRIGDFLGKAVDPVLAHPESDADAPAGQRQSRSLALGPAVRAFDHPADHLLANAESSRYTDSTA